VHLQFTVSKPSPKRQARHFEWARSRDQIYKSWKEALLWSVGGGVLLVIFERRMLEIKRYGWVEAAVYVVGAIVLSVGLPMLTVARDARRISRAPAQPMVITGLPSCECFLRNVGCFRRRTKSRSEPRVRSGGGFQYARTA
jgi:hypothetical protein